MVINAQPESCELKVVVTKKAAQYRTAYFKSV